MREEIKNLIANGAHGARNALFRALVDEIRVTGRDKDQAVLTGAH